MSHSHPADQILVLIDIQDPMTYDKSFVRSLRYSPFCAGGNEMNDASRKSIRAAADSTEDLFKNKFMFEIYVDKFGDFAAYFLQNDTHERALIFRDAKYVDEEGRIVTDEDENDEDDSPITILIQVYELITGPALKDKEESIDQDSEEEVDDALEDIELNGDSFLTPETKTLH